METNREEPRMVESWSDATTARERVETIATTLTEPRTANWVAEQADVKWDTAKKYLEALVESGVLVRTQNDEYLPDPTRAYFDHLRQLILENSKRDLRDELERISERIAEWKAEYNVDTPAELEATLAEDRDPDEVRDRRRALRHWEQSLESRDAIRTALELYDDVSDLANDVAGDLHIESAE